MASESEIQAVINTLIAEGIGEGEEGMRRIAETILTRASQRGMTPAEVVRQSNQYTGYSNPGADAVRAQSDPASISAAQAAWALAQGPDDPTGGANHYFNPSLVQPSWAASMTPTGQYQNHAFYTDRPVTPTPRVAPTPSSQSAGLSTQRSTTSPSGGNTALQSALTRLATVQANRVTPAPNPRNATPQSAANNYGRIPANAPRQPLAADLRATLQNPVTPFLSRDGGSVTEPAAIVFNDMVTSLGPSTSSRAAVASRPQTYAGQDTAPAVRRAVQTLAPTPAPVTQRVTARNRVPVSTPQSYAAQDRPIVRPQQIPSTANAAQTETQRLAALYSHGGPTQPRPILPSRLELETATGFRAPQSAQFTYDPTVSQPLRLPAGVLPPTPAPVLPPQRPLIAGATPATPPMPIRRPPRAQTAVATALSVQPPPLVRQPVAMALAQPQRAQSPVAMSNPIAQALSPVQNLQQQGFSPSQAYALANQQAEERARANASNPSHQSSNSWFNSVTG